MESSIINKIIKKHLEKEFKNVEYISGYYNKDLREPWDVLLDKSGEILVGGVTDTGDWFYDGTKLSYLISWLNISHLHLSDEIKKYINEKYDLNVKSVK